MNKYEKLEVEAESFIQRNGCASFNFKERDIILYDGGLFSIEVEKKSRPRIKWVDLPEGGMISKTIKGKRVKFDSYSAVFRFDELDETINYLKRMKSFLNKLGIKTWHGPVNM